MVWIKPKFISFVCQPYILRRIELLFAQNWYSIWIWKRVKNKEFFLMSERANEKDVTKVNAERQQKTINLVCNFKWDRWLITEKLCTVYIVQYYIDINNIWSPQDENRTFNCVELWQQSRRKKLMAFTRPRF